MTKCHEIMIVMDIVSAEKTNTIATKKTIAIDVTRTASINSHSKKVRDCIQLY